MDDLFAPVPGSAPKKQVKKKPADAQARAAQAAPMPVAPKTPQARKRAGATVARPTGLHCRGITVSGKSGTTKLLDNVSVDLALGDAYALCGRDNSAKRLLTRILASGMFADSAALCEDDSALLDLPFSKDSAYVADFGRCFSFMTCREYLKYMLCCTSLSKDALTVRVAELLSEVNLTPVADKKIARLSDFEYLMLCLALQLFYNPAVVIINADKLNCTAPTVKAFNAVVTSLKTRQKAVLVNCADIALVDDAFDVIGILQNGRIDVCGAPSEIAQRYAGGARLSIRAGGNVKRLAEKLRQLDRDMHVRVKRELLTVSTGDTLATSKLLVDTLSEENAELLTMNLRTPSLANAYKKVVNLK